MESIDVVYILGNGSRHNDLELKYSLRSLEKHLKNYRNIYLVGRKPSFLNDKIIFIPAEDTSKNKAVNIMRKVMQSANRPEISENFMFLNDDYFFVKDFDTNDCPYHWKATMEQTMEVNKTDYFHYVKVTKEELERRGYATYNFDNHKPIIFNKHKLGEVVSMYDWETPYGFILKSLYCNTLRIEALYFPDHKVVRPLLYQAWVDIINKPEVEVFSIHDRTINQFFTRLLDGLYTYPSSFELIPDEGSPSKTCL